MSADPGSGPPAAPGARRHRPWWVWALGGCGGCAVLLAILGVAAVVLGVNWFRGMSREIGPVTTDTVRQALGGEVPLYPGSTLDPATTTTMLITFRGIERAAGKKRGEMFQGVGVFHTKDSADKVLEYYAGRLPRAGWKAVQTNRRGNRLRSAYRREREMIMVQAQESVDGQTMVVLMRGGPEMAESAGQADP